MSEQAPLNPEPTQPAEGVVAITDGASAEKKKGKSSWLFNKKAGAKSSATKSGEGGGLMSETAIIESNAGNEEGGVASGEKKKHWWNNLKCPNSQRGEVNQGQQGISYGVNLVQRDDHQLQTGIDLGFEDIYGEPDNVHSLNGIWKTNHAVFQGVRSFFYKLFSCIVAIPLAVVFGVLFALVSVLSVFLFVPAGRLLSIPIGWVAKVWSVVVGAVCDPVFRSIGNLFSNVKVSRYGINSDPTAVMSA